MGEVRRSRPVRCRDCGRTLIDVEGNRSYGKQPCLAGTCLDWFCRDCGWVLASAGEPECPVCLPWDQ